MILRDAEAFFQFSADRCGILKRSVTTDADSKSMYHERAVVKGPRAV